MLNLIEKGVKGENQDDFMLEFEVYWQREVIIDIHAHIDTSDFKVRELNCWRRKNESEELIFVASEKSATAVQAANQIFHTNLIDAQRYRCIYFPLAKGTFLLPPLREDDWSFGTLKSNIFMNLSAENKKEFYKIVNRPINKSISKIEFLIVGLPLSNGNVALFGACLSGNSLNFKSQKNNKNKQIHPFVLKPKDGGILRADIQRWHPNFLLNRTGGNADLYGKHVIIVGLGSVGSEIALRMAKAGIGQLSLVDYDVMEPDNVHRHSLGSDQIFMDLNKKLYNKPKVMGIKEEIKRKYPFTQVETFPDNFLTVIEDHKIDFKKSNLIIIAIGSANSEMMINRKLYQLKKSPPVLYTWVEPLGIGGHTLVTLNREKVGCYQCLFKAEEDSPIYNRSAFAKPFQEFSKTITGCGSVFTPYNFLDSERSAMLAVDAGLKVLTDKLVGNPLLSWKGEGDLFQDYGYQTTKRYSFSTEQLEAAKYLYIDENCKVCSNEGRDTHQ